MAKKLSEAVTLPGRARSSEMVDRWFLLRELTPINSDQYGDGYRLRVVLVQDDDRFAAGEVVEFVTFANGVCRVLDDLFQTSTGPRWSDPDGLLTKIVRVGRALVLTGDEK